MNKKILVFSILFFLVTGLLFFNTVSASSIGSINGYAWSNYTYTVEEPHPIGGIGWVSLNGSGYGLDIENDGNINGYAWSSNIGWIDFNPASGYPGTPLHSAKVDLNTGNLLGWARVCSVFESGCSGTLASNEKRGGWDGWIKLSDNNPSNWGVKIDMNNGNLFGYAWGSDKVIGWLDFSYATTNLSFVDEPSNLTVSTNYCAYDSDPTNGRYIQLSWENNAGAGAEHEVEVSGGVGVHNTGAMNSFVVPPGSISWSTTYNWKVRTKDSNGNWSVWADGSNFTTPSNRRPKVGFVYSPDPVLAEETITFDGRGTQYASSYLWNFEGASSTGSLTSATTTAVFTYGNDRKATLQATNVYGSCSITQNLNVQLPVPDWQETTPFGKIKMFFGSIIDSFFNRIAFI